MVADNRQFPDLRRIVADTKDDRVWIFAEWVSENNGAALDDRQLLV